MPFQSNIVWSRSVSALHVRDETSPKARYIKNMHDFDPANLFRSFLRYTNSKQWHSNIRVIIRLQHTFYYCCYNLFGYDKHEALCNTAGNNQSQTRITDTFCWIYLDAMKPLLWCFAWICISYWENVISQRQHISRYLLNARSTFSRSARFFQRRHASLVCMQ